MTTKAELAGNYAMSGGGGDPTFVAQRLSEIHDDTAEQTMENIHHEGTRQHVEQTAVSNLGTITVDGEEIPLVKSLTEEIGMGHLARLDAQQRDRPRAYARSVVALIDALAECTADGEDEKYDVEFWTDLSERDLGKAYAQAIEQSRGGEKAGE